MSTHFGYRCIDCDESSVFDMNRGDGILVQIYDNKNILLPIYKADIHGELVLGLDFQQSRYFDFLLEHDGHIIKLENEYGETHTLHSETGRHTIRPKWYSEDILPPYYPIKKIQPLSNMMLDCPTCNTTIGNIRKVPENYKRLT